MTPREPKHMAKTNLLHRAIAVAAVALLVSCGDDDAATLLASAKTYLAKRDDRAAVIQLKGALQKQPELAEARFLLGRTLLDAGDPVSGEVELRKAMALKYPMSQLAPALVRALVMQGQAGRAIQDYGTTQLEPAAAAAELKVALATAYAQLGDSEKAQAALDVALRADPDSTQALLMQARLKFAAKDIDGAFAALERVIARQPTNHEALQLKGDLIYSAKGDADAAMKAHRRALAARPDWLPSHTSIIEMLLARDDLVGARKQMEALEHVLPNHPQTRYLQARLAYQGRDYKTAREKAQLLLSTSPDDVRALMIAGAIELRAGSLGRAEDFAAKAVRRAPDSVPARRLMARIQLRAGEAQQAQETLQPLLDKPGLDAETLNLVAQAALQLGDVAAAETAFGRAAKLNPGDARSRTALALADFSHGKADAALSRLQEIAASDTGTVADMAIVSARLRQRDYDAALKAIDSLEAKQADKPLASQLRGQVMLARQDPAGARASFAKALSIDPLYFPAAASLATLDLRDRKPDDARKRFEDQLAIDPNNLRALLAIVELRARAGAGKPELSALLEKAIRLNPTAAAPRALLVDLYLRSNDKRAALAAAQEGVAALPESPELLDLLGRAQLASGDATQALASFNKLASLRRTSPQPLLRVADAQMALHDIAAARDSVNRAIALAPAYLPARRGLIMVEIAAGNAEQAMAVARTMQQEHPKDSIGYLYAGEIEAFQRKWDAASAAYRKGLARAPSSELAVKLHASLVAGAKAREADVFAAGWIAQHPQDAAFLSYLGDAAVAQHDLVTAEARYLALAKLQPDSALALNNLAWVTHKLKKPGAIAYAEKANALQPDQPDILDTLATVLADEGQATKALEIEKKAIALNPDSPPLRLNLAKLYLKTGDKAQAKAELLALSKLGDKFGGQAEVGELLKTL